MRQIWVISEGIAGTENQALGVAEALGSLTPAEITVKRVGLRFPWSLTSPHLRFGEGPGMLTSGSDPVTPPWPDAVIAGGRKAIGIARFIRGAAQGKTLVTVVQNPRVSLSDFDLVATPFHDALEGPHVLVTDGAPNRITPERLADARDRWRPELSALPPLRIAVLIGGTSKTHQLGAAEMDSLIHLLLHWKDRQGAGLMVTVSRRTAPELAGRLRAALSGLGVHLWTGGNGENPYFGYLAWADHILCTSDSVSMLSDAATVGKPVHLFRLPGGSARFDRLYAHLAERGVIREARPDLSSPWTYPPFTDSRRVAEAIKTLLDERNPV